MAQQHLSPIDPNNTSGTELAALLSNWGAAVDSTNIGATRPPQIQPGQLWVDTSGGNTWTLKMATDRGDGALLLIDIVTGGVSFTGALGTITSSGVPTGRRLITIGSVVGGGTLGADLQLQLENDTLAGFCPPNYYYGTDGTVGHKGFFPLPAYTGSSGGGGFSGGQNIVRRIINTFGPGEYDWTAPSNVNAALVWMYGGGSSTGVGSGACMTAKIDVAPGSSFHISVGAVGGTTTVAGTLVCPPGVDDISGDAYAPAGINSSPSAPQLRPNYGAPNYSGFVYLEYIGP